MNAIDLETKAALRATHQRRLPGELGIWLFVLGDTIVFSALFLTFSYYRAHDPELYRLSREALDPMIGLINTCLLLTSSWCVVLAIRSAREHLLRVSTAMFAVAFVLGAVFIGVKGFEYADKIGRGITMMTNDFYMFYYVLTAIHAMHVLAGLGGLGYLIYRSYGKSTITPADIQVYETGATFWHMVDLLWIVLFPLLYLVH